MLLLQLFWLGTYPYHLDLCSVASRSWVDVVDFLPHGLDNPRWKLEFLQVAGHFLFYLLPHGAFVVSHEFGYALSARDWTMAKDILSGSTNPELYYFNANGTIPRGCLEIYLAYLQGGRPAMEAEFATGRQQLHRKAQAHPEDASLLSALAVIDAALGRKPEAIQEAKRAVEMLPVSEDAVDGPYPVYNLPAVYSMVNEPDLAFQQLAISVKTPGGATYGTLKLDPCWDPLRKDPPFDKLLAELVPRD